MTQEAVEDLDTVLRHARAGMKALEAAYASAADTGTVYPTHIYVATVELARAIELAVKVTLRQP